MADEQWQPTGYIKVYKALLGVAAAFFVAAMATLAIPGSQIYGWLRLGTWQPISNQDGLAYLGVQALRSDWVGLQSLIGWWLPQSFAGWLFGSLVTLGFLMFCFALKFNGAELALKHKWSNDAWQRKTSNRPPGSAA